MSNVHAWFANTTAEAAAAWVMTFFNETNVQPASLLPNKVGDHFFMTTSIANCLVTAQDVHCGNWVAYGILIFTFYEVLQICSSVFIEIFRCGKCK